jgi:pimeloyl-ACP methyl ester carboxylesterase
MAKQRALILCTLLAAAAFLVAQAGTPVMPQAAVPQAVDRTVNVGPCKLHFKIIKGGPLTILLESGGGMDSSEWASLAPQLAQATGATVVAYDRAGFGQSGLPDAPCEIKTESRWLWQGLDKLGLAKNVVLVGHSYGGMMIRAEAAERLAAVRGMVFVDPFTVEFVDQLGIDYCNNHPMMGKLPFDISQPEKLSKTQRAMVRMVGAPGSNLADKVAAVRHALIPAGIPLRLLTSGSDWLPKPEETKAWRQAHERLAASLSGMKMLVADSDHMIPFRQPKLIVRTVAEVCELVEARQPAKGEKKTLMGIEAGWAFGGYAEDEGPRYLDIARFSFHLGGLVQFDLNDTFGLQLNFSWQAFSHETYQVTEHRELFTVGLNGVFHSRRVNNAQPYFKAGGGFCFGSIRDYATEYFRPVLIAGGGVKFFLKPDLQSAVNLGMTFHGLLKMQKTRYPIPGLSHVQMSVGFEF